MSNGKCDLIFAGDHDPLKPMSENAVNKVLWVIGYGTKMEVIGLVLGRVHLIRWDDRAADEPIGT